MTTKYQNYLFGHRFLDNIVDWMRHNLMPENIFSREALADWARENSYVHESTIERTQSGPWRELWQRWFDQDVPSPWYYNAEQDVEFCVACGNNREYGHDDSCVLAKAKAMLEQYLEQYEESTQ